MEKQFIPYTLALALKELGFDGDCFAIWSGFDEINFSTTDKVRLYSSKFRINDTQSATFYINDFNSLSSRVAAPTFSQAFRWFREKYNISHSIDWMTGSLKLYSGYYVHFRGINNTKINQDNYIVLNDELPLEGYRVYETYEEAELECLKKLIEIVKNKI